MDGAADPRIVQRLLLAVHPGSLDDRLVEGRCRHAGRLLSLARRHRIDDAAVVDAVRQQRRAELGRERQRVVELDAVEIGQPLVPVGRVLLHHPDFVLDAALALERAGAGNVDHAAQVVVVVLQRLLADDRVPAAGEGRHHEAGRPRFGELEDHRLLVGRHDLAHRREQRTARDADAVGRLADAVVGGLDVLRREVGAVVERHALAQMEGVGLAVLGDLPAMGEIGNDGLAAVARIAPHQVVEHAALRAQAVDRARLVHVEVRRSRGDGVFQDATRFGVRFRRRELEFGPVELGRYSLGECLPWHAEYRGRCGRGALDEVTTVYAWTRVRMITHGIPPVWPFPYGARCALMCGLLPVRPQLT